MRIWSNSCFLLLLNCKTGGCNILPSRRETVWVSTGIFAILLFYLQRREVSVYSPYPLICSQAFTPSFSLSSHFGLSLVLAGVGVYQSACPTEAKQSPEDKRTPEKRKLPFNIHLEALVCRKIPLASPATVPDSAVFLLFLSPTAGEFPADASPRRFPQFSTPAQSLTARRSTAPGF